MFVLLPSYCCWFHPLFCIYFCFACEFFKSLFNWYVVYFFLVSLCFVFFILIFHIQCVHIFAFGCVMIWPSMVHNFLVLDVGTDRAFTYKAFPYVETLFVQGRNLVPSRPAIGWRKVNKSHPPTAGLLGTRFLPWTN